MMMPFGTAFAINNLHITNQQLPVLYMIAGVSTLIIMPIIGRLSDRIDKFKLFSIASVWMMIVCVLYTNLSVTPFWEVIVFNIVMMIGIMSRMIPSGALVSAVPEMSDRGAFMSINASLQQNRGVAFAAAARWSHRDAEGPVQSHRALQYRGLCDRGYFHIKHRVVVESKCHGKEEDWQHKRSGEE